MSDKSIVRNVERHAEMSGAEVMPEQSLIESTRSLVQARRSGGDVMPVRLMSRVSSAGHSRRSGRAFSLLHPFNCSSVRLALLFSTGGAASSVHSTSPSSCRWINPDTSGGAVMPHRCR